MLTRFVQVSWGLDHTNTFLNVNTIKEFLQSLKKHGELSSNCISIIEIASLSQDRMQEEIAQHIRISDKMAKEELYDYLTGWIEHFELCLANTDRFINLINDYNEKRLIEYEEIVRKQEEEFKSTDKYRTLKHLEFYEQPNWFGVFGGKLQKTAYHNPNRLVEYRKFIEAPDPDLIDPEYLPQYIALIRPIISRCIVIAHQRLSYLKGPDSNKKLAGADRPPEIAAPVHPGRLKVSLNTDQLAVFMRLLHDVNIINSSKGEIHAFVSEHIQTVGMTDKKISASNFGKLFSSKNSEISNFLIGRLYKMIELAGKK